MKKCQTTNQLFTDTKLSTEYDEVDEVFGISNYQFMQYFRR